MMVPQLAKVLLAVVYRMGTYGFSSSKANKPMKDFVFAVSIHATDSAYGLRSAHSLGPSPKFIFNQRRSGAVDDPGEHRSKLS